MSATTRSFILALVIACGLSTGSVVFAQEATPAGEVIDASECQVEPRASEELEQIAGAAPEDGAEATPAISEIGGLTGEPADEAVVEGVTATYRELVACLNAGDYLRIYALYTDEYVQRTLAEGEQDIEELEATPAADETGSTALVSVGKVRQLDDGRVAARVET